MAENYNHAQNVILGNVKFVKKMQKPVLVVQIISILSYRILF